ncbi:MAG: RHS repeat domain-containing protein [Gammaproteobacteria bacterium]
MRLSRPPPLAQISGTAIAYLHTDHLGTPESLTDQGQAIVWQAHHDPFGRTTMTTRTVEHHLRFPGQYFDAETGLHYNYFRDYDPSIGRYVQSDPIGLARGINPYLYANANPLRYTDPTGEIVLALPAIAPALAALGEAVAFVGSAVLARAVLSEVADGGDGVVPFPPDRIADPDNAGPSDAPFDPTKTPEICRLREQVGRICVYRCASDGFQFTTFVDCKGDQCPGARPRPR